MRMRLGRRGDYAVRAVLDLSLHEHDGRRKTREIAHDMNIPESYLPQILAQLVSAGLVRSLAGRDGGYALAQPAEQTNVLDVIEKVEGETKVEDCVLRGGPCSDNDPCAFHDFWVAGQNACRDQLRATSFADIVAAGDRWPLRDPSGERTSLE